MKKRLIFAFGAAMSFALCTPVMAATEGEWTNGGRSFMKADGSLARNEWIEGENGAFFYVDGDGNYVTGWQTVKESNSDTEHQYYFNPVDGAMFYNTYTPDGYWVNMDGVWTEGVTGPGPIKESNETGSAEGSSEQEESAENTSVQEEAETPAPEENGEEQAEETSSSSESEMESDAVTGDAVQTESNDAQTESDTGAQTDNGSAQTESNDAQTESDTGVQTEDSAYSESNADILVALLNQRRIEAGKEALPEDADLMAAAQIRAQEIAQNPDGSGIYLRPEKHYLAESGTMTDSSVSAVSKEARKAFTSGRSILITESAAWGVSAPKEAVEDWFAKNQNGEDKSNKRYLLDVDGNGFNAIGASCYVKDGKQYYSVFIGVRH